MQSNNSGKKILLTGASGFIGSHVLVELLRRGYEVHAVVHNSELPEQPGLVVHRLDILNFLATREFIRHYHFTHLLHFAWYVGTDAHVHNLNLRWLTASLHLLECFARYGGIHFLGAGTCAEYEYKYGWMREDTTPTNPGTLYGNGKNTLYQMARIFCFRNGIAFQWPRIFNCYGYGDNRLFRLIPSVLSSCLHGEDVRVSECLNYKDFLYIEDTACGIVDLFESQLDGAVNISSGIPVRLRTIVELIARFTDFRGKVLWGAQLGAPENEMVVGDNARLRCLGWKPLYDLSAGLQKTIDDWRRHV